MNGPFLLQALMGRTTNYAKWVDYRWCDTHEAALYAAIQLKHVLPCRLVVEPGYSYAEIVWTTDPNNPFAVPKPRWNFRDNDDDD